MSCPPTPDHTKRMQVIENQTARQVSIETGLTPENIARCNGQTQSPLFSTLPPEIRNHIFSLALLQYEDLPHRYAEHDYCYRPGHRAQRLVSTSLLETCRLVWLEANHWPMTQAVHSFWFEGSRRPDWSRLGWHSEDDRVEEFFADLTSLQRSRVKHIHIFAQMYWLESDVATSKIWKSLSRERLDLESFTITIRHSDWWNWESDQRLEFRTAWLRKLLASAEASRTAEVRLELETLEWKVVELREIVEKLKQVSECRKSECGNSECASARRWELVEPCEESTWSGPVNLGGHQHSIYARREKLDYRVVSVKWRRVPTVDLEQRWREEGSLLKLCGPPESREKDERDESSSEEEMFEVESSDEGDSD